MYKQTFHVCMYRKLITYFCEELGQILERKENQNGNAKHHTPCIYY